ncbi:hypothetical protein [Facilibium subflavum]|uniref:hypothetical protein n=1 Tax=Facilibium subflavum TaxID=2219058 RepID=UPI000E648FE3|nr:hypothetical protein [Facilibium subflavum]
MFPLIAPGKSATLSYSVSGNVTKFLNKPEIISALKNNSENKLIKIGAAGYLAKYPTINVSVAPYDYVAGKKQLYLSPEKLSDTISLFLPDTVISDLTLIQPDLSQIETLKANGIELVLSFTQGNTFKPAQHMSITATANEKAQTALTKFDLIFEDAQKNRYHDTLSINTDATTHLSATEHNIALLTNGVPKTLTVQNTGIFNALLPQVLTTLFNAHGLHIIDIDCAGKILSPQTTCQIKIIATKGVDPVIDITIIGDEKNLKTGEKLITVHTFDSNSQFAEILPLTSLPDKAKVNSQLKYAVEVTPLLDLTHIKLFLSDSIASASHCMGMSNAQTLTEGTKYIYQCNISQSEPSKVFGHVEIDSEVLPDKTMIQLPLIDVMFVKDDQLPGDGLVLQKAVVFAAGNTIDFTIKNNTGSALQGFNIDLSGLSNDFIQHLQLKNPQKGIHYDQQAGIISVEDTLLANDQKQVSLTLALSPDALKLLNDNAQLINDNATKHQAVKLTSKSTQDYYPPLYAATELLSGLPDNMPYEVYAQIDLIASNRHTFGRSNLLKYKDQVIPLGYFAPTNENTSTTIKISFSPYASDILKANQKVLESLKAPAIQINAANLAPISPIIEVIPSAVDAQNIIVDTPKIQTIYFTNHANYAVSVVDVDSEKLPPGVQILKSGSCKESLAIPPDNSCHIDLKITQDAHGSGSLTLYYQLTPFITADKKGVPSFYITSEISITPAGVSFSAPDTLEIPLPHKEDHAVNIYGVTFHNLGNFDLYLEGGLSNIGDAIHLVDAQGQIFDDENIRLLNRTCFGPFLAANQSCNMQIMVTNLAPAIDNLTLSTGEHDFINIDRNNISTASFDVIRQDAAISIEQANKRINKLTIHDNQKIALQLVNTGGKQLTIINRGIPSWSGEQPNVIGCMQNVTLEPGENCEITLQSYVGVGHGIFEVYAQDEDQRSVTSTLEIEQKPQERLMYITPGVYIIPLTIEMPDGIYQGIDAANMICNYNPDKPQNGKTFKAWLSTSRIDAKDNVNAQPGVRYIRTKDGVLVTDQLGKADKWQNMPFTTKRLTDYRIIWTGTIDYAGNKDINHNCHNWKFSFNFDDQAKAIFMWPAMNHMEMLHSHCHIPNAHHLLCVQSN